MLCLLNRSDTVPKKGEIVMSKNRKRYREKRKNKRLEEILERNNEYGIHDPTPFEAVREIIKKEKERGNKLE